MIQNKDKSDTLSSGKKKHIQQINKKESGALQRVETSTSVWLIGMTQKGYADFLSYMSPGGPLGVAIGSTALMCLPW